MADAQNPDHGGRIDPKARVGGLILGAVVLGILALLTFPAVVDWGNLGQAAICAVSAAGAILLGTQAARMRREPG